MHFVVIMAVCIFYNLQEGVLIIIQDAIIITFIITISTESM
jgi:hypothetical protein